MVFGACRGFFESGWAQAQYRQIDIRIMLGKIGFEWFSAHAEGFLKAVGRKPSGVGSSVVFHARTLRKLLGILTHRAACAAPLSFADYQEMQLHQCPDLTVLGASPPVSGQVSCSTLEHLGNYWIF